MLEQKRLENPEIYYSAEKHLRFPHGAPLPGWRYLYRNITKNICRKLKLSAVDFDEPKKELAEIPKLEHRGIKLDPLHMLYLCLGTSIKDVPFLGR